MWETIKQILKKNIGTCIIVEEGKPTFAILPLEDYEKLLNERQGISFLEKNKEGSGEQEILEKINQEITNWKARQMEENPEIALEQDDDLKIENLPLA
jgi:hypothetical protein